MAKNKKENKIEPEEEKVLTRREKQDQQKQERFRLEAKAAKGEPMTQKEMETLNRERRIDTLNKVLRLFGLITATVLFLYLWNLFKEASVYGAIFDRANYNKYWADLQANGFFQMILDRGVDKFIGTTIITVLWAGSMVAYAMLVTQYLIDLVELIKHFINNSKNTIKKLTSNVKESLDVLEIPEPKTRKKVKKEKTTTPEKKTTVKKPAVKKETKKVVEKKEEEKSTKLDKELEKLDKEYPSVFSKVLNKEEKKEALKEEERELNKLLTSPRVTPTVSQPRTPVVPNPIVTPVKVDNEIKPDEGK